MIYLFVEVCTGTLSPEYLKTCFPYTVLFYILHRSWSYKAIFCTFFTVVITDQDISLFELDGFWQWNAMWILHWSLRLMKPDVTWFETCCTPASACSLTTTAGKLHWKPNKIERQGAKHSGIIKLIHMCRLTCMTRLLLMGLINLMI